MGASVACGVLMERAVYFSNLQHTNMPISAGVRSSVSIICVSTLTYAPQIWMGSGAVCNVIIAVCMTIYVRPSL